MQSICLFTLLLLSAYCNVVRTSDNAGNPRGQFERAINRTQNAVLCATSQPSASYRSRSGIECANLCLSQCNVNNVPSWCNGANYKAGAKLCELFFYQTYNYSTINGCTYLKNKVMAPTVRTTALTSTAEAGTQTTPRVTTTAPYFCSNGKKAYDASTTCSFPFTYSGGLYYGCITNMVGVTTGDCPIGCLKTGYIGIVCQNSSINFNAVTVNETINIPSQPVLVTSVFGWIVIMQRVDLTTSWNYNWNTYAAGFGSLGGNYWLGLENMHQLATAAGATYALRVELQDQSSGLWYSVEYSTFSVGGSAQNYPLSVSGLAGDSVLGNPLSNQNGMSFTTSEADNDNYCALLNVLGTICLHQGNCATSNGGGFWFNNCYRFCPTCLSSSNDVGSFRWSAVRLLMKD